MAYLPWTLSSIRAKVRTVTGRPSIDQIDNATVDTYINNYYVYAMPLELKVQIENKYLQFNTTPGIDQYSFPDGYFTDQPGAYADGFPLVFYQDPDIFFQDWPQQYAVNNIATGDGVTSIFSGGLQNPPVIIGTTFIVADDPTGTQAQQLVGDAYNSGSSFPTATLYDNGDPKYVNGVPTAPSRGTINYLTGAYTVTFANAPVASAVIYTKYQGYSGNRPQGVLFFQNTFTFRSVPDQSYAILMQGYVQPVIMALDTDTPLQQEWGPLIAYGAALEIFQDTGDIDNYNSILPEFKRYENIALGRTIQELTSQQSVPRF